jgi:hypothetical protein
MSSSTTDTALPLAHEVHVDDEELRVELADGRTIIVPTAWYPRLLHASQPEREDWRLTDRGECIHWEQLDEDISVQHLLAGRRSNESPASLVRWLEERRDAQQRTDDPGANPAPAVNEEFWRDLREFVRKLGEECNADRIILFGSHAQGRAAPDSDVDLLIVAESDLPRLKRLQKLYASAPKRDFPVDFLWYTPEEVEEHAGQTLTLIGRILQEGLVLYA